MNVTSGQIIDIFEGRYAADLRAWLPGMPASWRAAVQVVSAIRTRATRSAITKIMIRLLSAWLSFIEELGLKRSAVLEDADSANIRQSLGGVNVALSHLTRLEIEQVERADHGAPQTGPPNGVADPCGG